MYIYICIYIYIYRSQINTCVALLKYSNRIKPICGLSRKLEKATANKCTTKPRPEKVV